MSNTTKRGRPAKKTEPSAQEQPAVSTAKFQVKQRIEENRTFEYKLLNGGGAVYMMHQKGVTVYDKKLDTIREIRYCPNEGSIYRDTRVSLCENPLSLQTEDYLSVQTNRTLGNT